MPEGSHLTIESIQDIPLYNGDVEAAEGKTVFGNKPVAVLGASRGGFGTILSQNAWLPVLRTLGTKPWFGGRLMVSHAQSLFDEHGTLTDETIRKQLEQFLRGFVQFIAREAQAR